MKASILKGFLNKAEEMFEEIIIHHIGEMVLAYQIPTAYLVVGEFILSKIPNLHELHDDEEVDLAPTTEEEKRKLAMHVAVGSVSILKETFENAIAEMKPRDPVDQD